MTPRIVRRATTASALVVAALALALVACASPQNPEAERADDGALELVVRDGHLRELGASCSGARPYLEFHKGAEFALLDDDGHAVFSAPLGDGEAVKVDDIDYGAAPRIPTFCRFVLGTVELDHGESYDVSIDGHVVAEHRADAGSTMVFVPALASIAPTTGGTE